MEMARLLLLYEQAFQNLRNVPESRRNHGCQDSLKSLRKKRSEIVQRYYISIDMAFEE